MTQPIRTLSVRRLAVQQPRSMANRTWLPPIHTTARRSYSARDKVNEAEPGGQRRLIIAACVAVPTLGVLWMRSGKQTLDDAGRGANQEYKKSAEGNK
ncbi:uncharacterized protein N7498_006738 [Penicillium cinerascens]|uniref:Uncharacterized protein n=1 Tax=Penicillium cinerascens TaxID=70096 RepID=A0A9W9MIU8_9EURO|nr:uncharacterized protein N7498_006738 [Penicillium cinerascens]KAJ5202075.1 hypothetical protein N7498_006738 [Penicillium cinerascens]